MPCSGRETIAGVIWLPRLLEKARRSDALGGERLFEGYCYGDNDFIDKQVMAFLRTDDETISSLVREHASDAEVARIVIERSGRSPVEFAAFDRTLRKKLFNFEFLEADEGRLPPGPRTAFVRFFYNRIMMPIVYAMFRRDERKRRARSA